MLKRDYEGQNCSVASALEIVGERWTLLIIRDAFAGLSRFEEFRESLGLARNVLTDRLDKLVEHGIFERVPYGDRADRFDYTLTQKGPRPSRGLGRPAPVARQIPVRQAADGLTPCE